MSLAATVLVPLVLQLGVGAASDSVTASPRADAYLDSAAAEMVRQARARSESENRLIQGYRVVAREQEVARLRAFGRDRLIFRQDRAARIEWERDSPTRVEVLGSRQRTPLVSRDAQVASDGDIADGSADLVFEPDREWILDTPMGGEDADEGSFIHPLAAGSEEHYRFRSGDTTRIRLPDGGEVRLVELQVVPRRTDHRLVSGSLWLNAESFAPVRGAFRFSVPVAVGLFSENGSWGASGEFRLFLVEYGLWEGRWWLPRLFAYEGSATLGSMAMTLRKEIRYEDYEVFSDSAGAARPPSSAVWQDTARTSAYEIRTDTMEACSDSRRSAAGTCPAYEIWLPRDRSALLSSEHLPPADPDGDASLLTDAEIRQGVEALYASGVLSEFLPRANFRWRWIDPSLFHYNRVEGPTIGTSASVELANLRLDGSAWLGVADRSLGFETALTRSRYSGAERISAYRRLDAFTPRDRPFELGNSLSALAFGRDQGDYYRSLGVEVGWAPAPEATPYFAWRAYAERQSAVVTNTDFSLWNALRNNDFRSNPAADEADQLGIGGTFRLTRGFDPMGWRGGIELDAIAEGGTYRFLRPGARAFLGMPLPGPLVGSLEVAGGTSFGTVPVQRLWYLGSPSTVRGIDPESRVGGEAFWRGGGEVATELPGVRLVGFGDVGWAGSRQDLSIDPSLLSVGVGVSFLDGLIRADLAHPVREGSGWRLELYLGGSL